MCWSLLCFSKQPSKERLHPLSIPLRVKVAEHIPALISTVVSGLFGAAKYSLNWTRENLCSFDKNKGAAGFLSWYFFFWFLFKSIAMRFTLDVLLFHFSCYLLITKLLFFNLKNFLLAIITRNIQEHLKQKTQWELPSLLNVFVLFCIIMYCFFNTFICSFFPAVEQEEREKHFKKKQYKMTAWQGELRASSRQ